MKLKLLFQEIHSKSLKMVVMVDSFVSVDKPRYVRVNTLKMSVNDAVDAFRDEGWTLVQFTDVNNYERFLETAINLQTSEFMVDIHIKELLLFPPNTQFYNHEAYRNGSIILQDKVRCFVANIFLSSSKEWQFYSINQLN